MKRQRNRAPGETFHHDGIAGASGIAQPRRDHRNEGSGSEAHPS
jgi:hypothetical protein